MKYNLNDPLVPQEFKRIAAESGITQGYIDIIGPQVGHGPNTPDNMSGVGYVLDGRVPDGQVIAWYSAENHAILFGKNAEPVTAGQYRDARR